VHKGARWTLGFTESEKAEKYREIAKHGISIHLISMQAAGVTSEDGLIRCKSGGIYTKPRIVCCLEYEEALCRQDSADRQKAAVRRSQYLDRRPHRVNPMAAQLECSVGGAEPASGLKCGPSNDQRRRSKLLMHS